MLTIERGGSAYGARLITDRPYAQGELIYKIEGYKFTPAPTYQTIQVSATEHIEELGVLAYLNHSCQPNTIVNTTDFTVTAARDIAAGEELNFFYPSTEWEMDRPFVCLCGSPQCVRLVAGAKYLSVDALSRHFINKHISQIIVSTLASAQLVPVLSA